MPSSQASSSRDFSLLTELALSEHASDDGDDGGDEAKEQFLSHNVIRIREQPFALQDIDRPLTYLQVFDAPHEMPDATIVQRLVKYCHVLHHRRGYFREEGCEHVQDAVCHFRVQIKHNIPNYIRFGKILIHFCYEGQLRTCRHCNQTGHYIKACHLIICYNCKEIGHVASKCPSEILCNICKQPDHCAKNCPFSWARETEAAATADNDEIPAENTRPELPVDEPSLEESQETLASAEDPSNMSMDVSPEENPESTPSDTLELFEESPPEPPPPKPQRSKSGTHRQPAAVQPIAILSGTPTQPVLVAEKSREN